MRALLAAALVAVAGGAHAETSEAQARVYLWSALMTGAAHAIVSPQVALAPALREKLALREDADRNRIYDALVGLTRGRLIRVREATADEAAALGALRDGHAVFVVEGAAAPLLLAYDLQSDQLPAIALLAPQEPERAAQVIAPPARVVTVAVVERERQRDEMPPGFPLTPFLVKPLYFAHGDAALSAEAERRLDEAGLPKIVEVRGVHYVVRGHSDRLESAQFHQRLSEQRAEAVRDYLVARGAAAENIRLLGLGSAISLTACSQRDAAVLISCLGADRRVTVEIIPRP